MPCRTRIFPSSHFARRLIQRQRSIDGAWKPSSKDKQTGLMLEVTARRADERLPTRKRRVNCWLVDNQDSERQFAGPVLSKEFQPLYLKRTLLFPYDDGEKFQQALFLHDGKPAFARVFRPAPVSTCTNHASGTGTSASTRRRIRTSRSRSNIPNRLSPARWANWRRTYFSNSMQVRTGLTHWGRSSKAADYRIDGEVKADHRTTLACTYRPERTRTPPLCTSTLIRKILRAKWKQIEVTGQDGARFSGKSEDGYFVLVRNGSRKPRPRRIH